MNIRAIETSYKGYRFRSRLEARWAVFFDALGIVWEYEKEGYALPSGPYLPDFFLPQIKTWVEIKGIPPDRLESNLAGELASLSGYRVVIFSGQVPGFAVEDEWSTDIGGEVYFPHQRAPRHSDFYASEHGQSGEAFFPDDSSTTSWGWDNFYLFCVCHECGKYDIQFEGRSDRMNCKEFGNGKGCSRTGHNGDRGHAHTHPRILEAVRAARSARFEHGQRG